MLSRCFLDFSVGVRASVIGLSQISSLSLILSQMISDDFMDTKGKHHIGFISFNVKCPNVYTHALFPAVV